MPMVQKGVAAMSNHLPKVISPKGHAMADCLLLGGLAAMGALLWKKNKRASVAALACAGAGTANTLLTDSAGGVAKLINFRSHGKIDMGLAAMCSAVPNFMGFDGEPEAKYFRVVGLGLTVAGVLTDFRQSGIRKLRLRRIA